MPTHYQTLGVSRTASMQEIRQAFRKKALENHPDKNPAGEHLFKEITRAYETLWDEDRRRTYDGELDVASQRFGVQTSKPQGGPTQAQREAFAREEKKMMAKIFEQDKAFMQRLRKENSGTREELENWYRDQARAFSGEDSEESLRRKEERRRQQESEKADQEARRARLRDIEEELQQQKEKQRKQQEAKDRQQKDKQRLFDDQRKEIFRQLQEEDARVAQRMRELEEKWSARQKADVDAQREMFRQECDRYRQTPISG